MKSNRKVRGGSLPLINIYLIGNRLVHGLVAKIFRHIDHVGVRRK